MAGSNSFWQLSKCRNWTWITPVYYRTKNARKLLTALNFRHGTKLSQSLIFLRFFIASIFPLFSSLTADIDTRVKKNCYLMNDTKSLRNIDSLWYCFRLAFFFFHFFLERSCTFNCSGCRRCSCKARCIWTSLWSIHSCAVSWHRGWRSRRSPQTEVSDSQRRCLWRSSAVRCKYCLPTPKTNRQHVRHSIIRSKKSHSTRYNIEQCYLKNNKELTVLRQRKHENIEK